MHPVLVSIDVILMKLALPLVGDPGDRYYSDLVPLPKDFLVGKRVEVVRDQPR